MTFRGIQTRTVDIPASESAVVPVAGRHLSVAELFNTDFTSKTRPVVALRMQSQDRPAELIADVRQGDQFEADAAFDQVELNNLTASAVRITVQTSAEEITRDLPRLPVFAAPWIIGDEAATVYTGGGTLAAGSDTIIAPSANITLDRVTRSILLLRVTSQSLYFGTNTNTANAFSLAANDPAMVLENVTDLFVYAPQYNADFEWTLLVTGVIER